MQLEHILRKQLTSMRKTPSSHWGRRLLPSRIDELAQQAPKKIWVSIPSRNPADGFQDITWAIAANAINCAAWWIESTLGPGGGSTPIAYMGLQDIRYPLLLVAAIKSGYVVSSSTRLSLLLPQLTFLCDGSCSSPLPEIAPKTRYTYCRKLNAKHSFIPPRQICRKS